MEKVIILIAEDDENDVFLLTRALEKAGIAATTHYVLDGQYAMDYLAGKGKYADRSVYSRPHFAIFDLKMPRRDGFEALAWLRRESPCKEMPVMILSSSGLEQDIKKAFALGANAYVVKSGDPEILAQELKRFYTFWAPLILAREQKAKSAESKTGEA